MNPLEEIREILNRKMPRQIALLSGDESKPGYFIAFFEGESLDLEQLADLSSEFLTASQQYEISITIIDREIALVISLKVM